MLSQEEHNVLRISYCGIPRNFLAVVLCLVATVIDFGGRVPEANAKPQLATTGTYTFNFFNSGQGAWMTVITSTLNKVTDCTITWNGSRNGQAIYGHNGFVLSQYFGRGAAIVSRYQYLNVYNFNATCLCKTRD
jgi:hypothetical protein